MFICKSENSKKKKKKRTSQNYKHEELFLHENDHNERFSHIEFFKHSTCHTFNLSKSSKNFTKKIIYSV